MIGVTLSQSECYILWCSPSFLLFFICRMAQKYMHCTKINNMTSENQFKYIMCTLSLLLLLCCNSLGIRLALYYLQFNYAYTPSIIFIPACLKMPWNLLEALELDVFVSRTTDMVELVAWKVNVEMSPHAEFAQDGRKPATTPS